MVISKEFRINRIDTNFNGQYRCEVESLIEEKTLSDSIDLSVRPLALPVIVSERLNSSKITTGSTWNAGKLYCNATGVPEPTISWLKVNMDKILVKYVLNKIFENVCRIMS